MTEAILPSVVERRVFICLMLTSLAAMGGSLTQGAREDMDHFLSETMTLLGSAAHFRQIVQRRPTV